MPGNLASGVEINFNQGACWIPTNPSHAIDFQAKRPHITGQFKNQKHLETINLVSTSASAAPMQATGPISRKNKHVLPSHAIRGGEGGGGGGGQEDTNNTNNINDNNK